LLPLHLDTHPTRIVDDVAGEGQPRCQPIDKGAKANTLDGSKNIKLETTNYWVIHRFSCKASWRAR
jgi:hypothetical protein